jgi:8-oxo-dGTP diphosphatase
VTGAVRARKLVVAALVREQARVLMSRRRPDQAMPDLWEFPGGKVEPGEHPEAALRREVREELGCDIEIDRIEEVVFHAYPDFDLYMLVYASRITAGTPRAIEVADVRWVAAADLPSLDLLPADYPLARKLAAAAPGRQASGGDSG